MTTLWERVDRLLKGMLLGLLLGLIVGLWDVLTAPSLAGESTTQRVLGILFVDLWCSMIICSILCIPFVRGFRQMRSRILSSFFVLLFSGLSTWQVLSQESLLEMELTLTRLMSQPLPNISHSQQRGVLLISLDTVRADALSSMPNLQRRILKKGIQFTQAYSTSTWTLPAMASVHTGKSVVEHGAHQLKEQGGMQIRSGLSRTDKTLAELLRDKGFISAAVVTNPFNGIRYGFHRGFDYFIDLSRLSLRNYALRRSVWFRWTMPAIMDTGNVISEQGKDVLSHVKGGQFFLWLHYLDAHAPYSEHPDRFDPLGECSLPDCFNSWSTARQQPDVFTQETRDHIRSLYLHDVTYLDQQLEKVFTFMDEEGMWEQTLVLLVSDHGEEFWEHGGVEHGANFFNTTTKSHLLYGNRIILQPKLDKPLICLMSIRL